MNLIGQTPLQVGCKIFDPWNEGRRLLNSLGKTLYGKAMHTLCVDREVLFESSEPMFALEAFLLKILLADSAVEKAPTKGI